MINSESDFLGSISSDLLFTNEIIPNKICRDIMNQKMPLNDERKRKRRIMTNIEFKRVKTTNKTNIEDSGLFEKNVPEKITDRETEYEDHLHKRRNSTCMIFTSEMSNDGLREILKDNVDKKIEFLSTTKKKSFSLFEDSFYSSSQNNLSFDKNDLLMKSSDVKMFLNSFDKMHSFEKNCNQKILDQKPFETHWALIKEKKSRIFSVPEIRSKKEPLHRKHLIDFWKNVECDIEYSLPILGSGSSDSLMRISVDTVCQILKLSYNVKFEIIDCRFEYEFQGGHIKNAININTTDKMDFFYKNKTSQILIFHCEYSSIRAPRLAHYLRNMDRNLNEYPNLKFNEVYIMEGGYKKFYELHQAMCTPMRYVSMDDYREKGDSINPNL